MEPISKLNDVIEILKGLGPEALTVVLVIAIGYMMRAAPWPPNKFIPLLCPLLGALFYWGIGNPGEVSPELRNPEVKLFGFGLILGVLAWALHYLVIARIEAKLSQWQANKTPAVPAQENQNEQNP